MPIPSIPPSAPVAATLGILTSGQWARVATMFRLRLTGTGTLVMDSKDSLDNITLSVFTTSGASATNQIEFPYAGDSAVQVRVALTNTLTAEVI